MGFFDMDVHDSLDEMFDRNGDGLLDPLEQAERWDYLQETGEFDGIDRDELELMDEDERREYLEREGYDPDDFDL